MPRAGLTPVAVVDAALELLDAGDSAPTLAAVAGHVGVAAPSLYKHVPGASGLRQLVALRVLGELTEKLRAAATGRSGDDAIAALLHAWRDYVLAHPHRYAAMPVQPLGDPDLARAASGMLDVVLAVLAGYGLTGQDAIHATRRIRAAAHGFATLEAQGGFGLAEDASESYQGLIDMITASLQ
ncbi:MAG: hypothetical protein QOD41_1157 [Cryptosporangiaceae bacterium]|nr:hypothetical protein [Cryptosporangiaceae bacterium]